MLGILGPGREEKYLLVYENLLDCANLTVQSKRGSHLVSAQGQHGFPFWEGQKRISLLGYFSCPA